MSHKYGTCLLIVVRLQHSHDQLLDVFELVGRVLTEREGEREGGGDTHRAEQTNCYDALSNNTTQHCCDCVRKCLTIKQHDTTLL